ncbi:MULTISPECIES: FAD-dependent monooxygenase [unclassified Streptomyces]|uniref:FAD-dependent monooxygenase n=1 Tax=unclassified Streptomyces TaxID=2593676 RepID=UPI000379696B|nr:MULTISPECIES: FAD-dependent monooxygenase [unclassified Streptomyces]
MRLPDENVESLNTLYSAWDLPKPWGRTPDNTTIERHAVYTFQARWADTWREGRLLLAGDAAHQMPPFAGQGMCSGLRDAMNLAWKLGLVLQGTTSAALLDTYTSERRDHVQHTIGMSMALGRVICVPDEAEAAERDARMIAVDADPARPAGHASARPGRRRAAERRRRLVPGVGRRAPGTGHRAPGTGHRAPGTGHRAPGAGHLTPQHRVTHRGRTAPPDDITGGGFVVLADGDAACGELDSHEREFLGRIGATILPLHSSATPGAEYADTDDAHLPHLREHGHVAAVVRPDFHLFGTAATPAELHSLTGQLSEQLRAVPPGSRPGGGPQADVARAARVTEWWNSRPAQ